MVTVKWLENRIKVTRRLINALNNEIRECDDHRLFNDADELAELKIRLQGVRERFVTHRKALL